MRTLYSLVVGIVFHSAGCGPVEPSPFQALDTADFVELLSLNPKRFQSPPPGSFHGWEVLRRTRIEDQDTRDVLKGSLMAETWRAVEDKACDLQPRHGIRLIEGDTRSA